MEETQETENTDSQNTVSGRDVVYAWIVALAWLTPAIIHATGQTPVVVSILADTATVLSGWVEGAVIDVFETVPVSLDGISPVTAVLLLVLLILMYVMLYFIFALLVIAYTISVLLNSMNAVLTTRQFILNVNE